MHLDSLIGRQVTCIRTPISIRDDHNETNGDFACNCATWKTQAKESFGNIRVLPELREHKIKKVKRRELSKLQTKILRNMGGNPSSLILDQNSIYHFKWRDMDFWWLIQHLISPHPKIRGCHIKIPDTVFFKNGKINLRIKSDHENFLIPIRNPKKLKITEIRSQFPTITRERRKRNTENNEIEDIIMDEQESRGIPSTIKTIKVDQTSISFSKGDAYKEFNLPQGKTLHGNFYRDIAIVQFYNENAGDNNSEAEGENKLPYTPKIYKPVSENEFLKIMSRRPNDEYWKGVEFIQTWIKAKRGIGKAIEIDFFPKINKKHPSQHINYNFRKFKADNWLLKNDAKQYCLKQAVKIWFYVSKLYNYEILRLKCTFLTDDGGVIWLSNVQKWYTRVKSGCKDGVSIFETDHEHVIENKKDTEFKPEFKFNHIHGELEQLPYEEKSKCQTKIDSLSQQMMNQFENMKQDTKILNYFEENELNSSETNKAIKELYPDKDFTIKDVLLNDSYSSKNLNSLTYGNHVPASNNIKSRSVMAPYGRLNQSQSSTKRDFSDYRKYSVQNVKKSTSLAQITGEDSELLNLFPKIKSRSQMRSLEGSRSKYANPLGLRRLGVYKKHKFSVSNKSRGTRASTNMSILNSKTIASEKTSRFALSIPYE